MSSFSTTVAGMPLDVVNPVKPARSWTRKQLSNVLTERLRPTQITPALHTLLRALHSGVPLEEALTLVSKDAHALLAPVLGPERALTVQEMAHSSDRTCRILFRTFTGDVIESVIIPAPGGRRVTLCVSSQVGCARKCAFCETGRLGLQRQLGADEIVDQFRLAQDWWSQNRGNLPAISNVVFMGMGEPFDNLDAVVDAIELLCDSVTFGLSAKRITVSTVGVANKLRPFFSRSPAHLALSLHAPDDERRSRVMPINQRVGLAELKSALLEAMPPGREVLVEYILFDGFNDSPDDAVLLSQWLADVPSRLNLIPANPGPDPGLCQPSHQRVLAFQKQLQAAGVRTMVRYPHGRDVGGACGQLAGARRSPTSD